MPRDGANIYTQPFPDVASDTTIESVVYNGFTSDVANDLNAPRPILAGGTGGATADAALTNLSAEKSLQVVTNYNSMVWMSGSFYSASSATGAPVAGHAFVGLVYLADSNNIVLEARDQNDTAVPGRKYVREKKAGTWSAWKSDSLTLTGTSEGVSGDTADMFFGLTGTAPSSAFIVNTESDISGINALEVSKAGLMTVRDTGGSGIVVLNKSAGFGGKACEIYGQTNSLSRWVMSLANTATESGGNVGSDFTLNRYDDSGALVDAPLSISRATGLGVVSGNPTDSLGIATKQYVDGIYNADVALTEVQKAQARENVYAAPFDALAYNGMQINGSMEVDQQYSGAATALISGNVRTDGWVIGNNIVSGTIQHVIDGPPGFYRSIKISVSAGAAAGAGGFVFIQHPIEGYRTSRLWWGSGAAKTVSLGFWFYGSRSGTYSGSIRNAATTRSYPFSFTVVANTWMYITKTIPGETTGGWGLTSDAGMQVFICMAVGTTFQGPADAWASANYLGVTGSINGAASAGDFIQVTGFIIVPGNEVPAADRSAFIMRPYDQELLTCRRYLRFFNEGATGFANGSSIAECSVQFAPVMRIAPTLGVTANIQTFRTVAGLVNQSSVGITTVSTVTHGSTWRFNNVTVVSGQGLVAEAQTNPSVVFDARF